VPLKSKKPFRRSLTVSRYRPVITPTFTETFSLGTTYAPNTGGLIQPVIQNVPEYANYARLYRSYRITKMQVLFLTNAQTAVSSGATNIQQPICRIAMAADRSAVVTAPTAELDVLNDDRCVVKQLDKLVSYTVYNPIPNLTMNVPPGTTTQAGVSLGPGNWLSWADALAVPHNGLAYWISGTGAGPDTSIYVRLTFQCCDPQ